MVYGHVAQTLDADPALREATMILRYEDLCENPEETIRRMMAHCRLEADETVIQRYAGQLKPPAYYRPEFSEEELRAISETINSPETQFLYRTGMTLS
jgi:hypothetical protein